MKEFKNALIEVCNYAKAILISHKVLDYLLFDVLIFLSILQVSKLY